MSTEKSWQSETCWTIPFNFLPCKNNPLISIQLESDTFPKLPLPAPRGIYLENLFVRNATHDEECVYNKPKSVFKHWGFKLCLICKEKTRKEERTAPFNSRLLSNKYAHWRLKTIHRNLEMKINDSPKWITCWFFLKTAWKWIQSVASLNSNFMMIQKQCPHVSRTWNMRTAGDSFDRWNKNWGMNIDRETRRMEDARNLSVEQSLDAEWHNFCPSSPSPKRLPFPIQDNFLKVPWYFWSTHVWSEMD